MLSGPASSSSSPPPPGLRGGLKSRTPLSLSLSAIVSLLEVRARGRDVGRVRDGGAVVMTGSGPRLGVLLLLAVLLQTVVVTITVLHFSTALNSVRSLGAGPGTARSSGDL